MTDNLANLANDWITGNTDIINVNCFISRPRLDIFICSTTMTNFFDRPVLCNKTASVLSATLACVGSVCYQQSNEQLRNDDKLRPCIIRMLNTTGSVVPAKCYPRIVHFSVCPVGTPTVVMPFCCTLHYN